MVGTRSGGMDEIDMMFRYFVARDANTHIA